MAFSVMDFRGKMAAHSLARSNRFEVIIVPPTPLSGYGREVSIMAESVTMPGMSITSKPFKTWGPNHQLPVGSDYGGDGININFYIDGRMELKRFFDTWMEMIVTGNDYMVKYQQEYSTSIYIYHLDEMEVPTYAIELIDAFPKSMAPIHFDSNATNQFARLNTTMAFRRWKEHR